MLANDVSLSLAPACTPGQVRVVRLRGSLLAGRPGFTTPAFDDRVSSRGAGHQPQCCLFPRQPVITGPLWQDSQPPESIRAQILPGQGQFGEVAGPGLALIAVSG